jgi:hypothetical protein
MKITGKHKIYGLVVLAGLGWLAFDQLSTPAEATAEEPGNFAAERRAAPGAGSTTAPSRLQDKLVATAQRLGDASHDPFEAPAWLTGQSSQAVRAAALRPTWKVTAILRSDAGGQAIIDGQPVRVGQSYQGYKLIQLQTRSAIFERDGERLIMTLAP